MTQQTSFEFLPPARPTIAPDISARKHGGNPHSVAANKRVAKDSQRERIRVYICACGWNGATSAEIEQIFGWAKNRFSGRLTELRLAGLIVDSGRTRDCCAVWVKA
jgi:hypothetical protein